MDSLTFPSTVRILRYNSNRLCDLIRLGVVKCNDFILCLTSSTKVSKRRSDLIRFRCPPKYPWVSDRRPPRQTESLKLETIKTHVHTGLICDNSLFNFAHSIKSMSSCDYMLLLSRGARARPQTGGGMHSR